MDISYLGHSSFKLKGKNAAVITDPYDKSSTGFSMPSSSADIVTISHDHKDHNAASSISGTARRPQPYIINAPGEYEVSGVGVFGWRTYHDDKKGEERGKNTLYSIHMDGFRIVHLGDLGHMLSEEEAENIGEVDILMVPVGGHYTIDAATAVKIITMLQPSIVIPMHYKTASHNPEIFAEISELDSFIKEMGLEGIEAQDKLKITETDLPEEVEVVVLKS